MAGARIAVLGLYSSGSTAVAGCLHHLGVTMGRRFNGSYYEPEWLSRLLRAWWDEPRLVEAALQHERVRVLRRWAESLEREGAKRVGAKHPLLSLCGPDLIEAWGEEVRFIWTWRPLENSIRSLARRGWWAEPQMLQQRLWVAANEFFAGRDHLRIEYAAMMADPGREIERLVEYVGIDPPAERMALAIGSVRPTSYE